MVRVSSNHQSAVITAGIVKATATDRPTAGPAFALAAGDPANDRGLLNIPMKLPVQPVVPRGRVPAVMRRLAKAIDGLEEPAVEKIAQEQQEDAFQVLLATMLSAQTKEAMST